MNATTSSTKSEKPVGEDAANGAMSDTGNAEADRIINRLSSSDPDFDDCIDAVAFIRKLVAEHKGPEGFATWNDAAVWERQRRLAAEKSLRDTSKELICAVAEQSVDQVAANGAMGEREAFADYRRGLMEAFHTANMINANRQGRTAEETCAYLIRSLAELANGGEARAALTAAGEVDELAMLVRQLARHVHKASPDNNTATMAMDYLERKGLAASPLRDAVPQPEQPTQAATLSADQILQIAEDHDFDIDTLGTVLEEFARALLAASAGQAEPFEKIARAIHYPACWDTAAYPTLDDAACEAIAAAKLTCSECGEWQSFPERDATKTNAEQGLYRKFEVRRVDGSDATGGKHDGCEYFVLDMTHDAHAPAALRAYAQACASTHPHLSADLMVRFGGERQGAALSEASVRQIAHRFGVLYDDRVTFYGDTLTDFIRAILAASAPTLGEQPQAAEPKGLKEIAASFVDWELVERMRSAEEIDSEEAGMLGAMIDSQAREIEALRAILSKGA